MARINVLIVLYRTFLYWIVLYYPVTILNCTILYCTVLVDLLIVDNCRTATVSLTRVYTTLTKNIKGFMISYKVLYKIREIIGEC